jgi:hypothetical protein
MERRTMDVTKVIAQGHKLADFVTSVENKLKTRHADCYCYHKDAITVIAIAQYFVRISSNLLTVVIVHETEDRQCEIEIVSGGGALGSFGITWGAERRANKKLIDILEETGVEEGITLQFD